MRMIRKILHCYKNAAIDTIKHDGFEHAGYIAFLCMISIFPFLVFFTAIIAIIGNKFLYAVSGESLISTLTSMLINSQFMSALQPRILEITTSPPQSFVGLVVMSVIWSASSLLEGLRTILNRAYRVNNPPSYLLRRMMSIFQFLLISFIVILITFTIKLLPIISALLIQMIEGLNKYDFIKSALQKIIIASKYGSAIILLLIAFLFLSYIYYLMPNKRQKFYHTFPGTFNTMILWLILTKAFQYYLAVFQQINIVYGSVAGIIIALLYFHMCSVVFIFGAELNYWTCRMVFTKK